MNQFQRPLEGVYQQNTLQEPSYTFFYVDRARRLQIAWHALKEEVELATGTDAIARIAASLGDADATA